MTTACSGLIRVLVVDDEPAIRGLLTRALRNEGVECEIANDGAEALEKCQHIQFDAVVTDLLMPGFHGHRLASELLQLSDRPLIIVFTGVIEPRLAKDLLARGVDDIVYKPAEFATFAAKIKTLVTRRQQHVASQTKAVAASPKAAGPPIAQPFSSLKPIDSAELDSRLRTLARVPTLSKAAIDVFRLTNEANSEPETVTAAAKRDPGLVSEILRLANSSFFNPMGKKISDTHKAVVRLGMKRVGELALTSAAFATIAQESVPFFSLSRVWRRCLASGICLEILAEQCADTEISNGLFCASIFQPMCRVILAAAFPETYQSMIKHALDTGKSLADLERKIFPESPGEFASRLLNLWGIPVDIHHPLRYTSQAFSLLSALKDPIRRRVELVKLAAFLGELADGQFEDFDLIDLPDTNLLKRLQVQSVDNVLNQCREDLKGQLAIAPTETVALKERVFSKRIAAPITLAYKRIQHEGIDFLPPLLLNCGVRLMNVAREVSDMDELVLCNVLNASATHSIARLRGIPPSSAIILADAANASKLSDYGRVIVLPSSFRTLKDTFDHD